MPLPPPPLTDFRRAALVATLRRSRMFADLSAADVEAVAEGCSLVSLEKGEMLFREGEKASGFYVVQTGAISVFRYTPDGREQIICVFRAPESFAEVALVTVETYPAHAVALEASHVVLVDKVRFRDLLHRKPELSLHMLASMSLHLKHLVQSLQNLKGRQIEYRLAEWLLAQTPSGQAEFRLPMTKKLLASQLGVTGETLSRTLGRFREEGVIAVEGRVVRILDRGGLEAQVAG